MEMNRDYLDILRGLRKIEMNVDKRREARREIRRAVRIAEVVTRVMDDHDLGGGRLVAWVTARLGRFSRAARNPQAA